MMIIMIMIAGDATTSSSGEGNRCLKSLSDQLGYHSDRVL